MTRGGEDGPGRARPGHAGARPGDPRRAAHLRRRGRRAACSSARSSSRTRLRRRRGRRQGDRARVRRAVRPTRALLWLGGARAVRGQRLSRSSASSAAGSAPATCSSGCRRRYRRAGDPALPRPAAGLAPPPRHRHPAVQRQLRRRGRVVPDRAAAVRGRHGRDARRPRSARCSSPTGCWRWSACAIFPALFALNVVYSRRMAPRQAARPAAAGRGQRDRARELRRRAGGQDDGPRGATRPSGSPRGPRELRDALIRSAGCAACSTRCWTRCPASARSPC